MLVALQKMNKLYFLFIKIVKVYTILLLLKYYISFINTSLPSNKRGFLKHFIVLQYTGKCNEISPQTKNVYYTSAGRQSPLLGCPKIVLDHVCVYIYIYIYIILIYIHTMFVRTTMLN